MDADGLGGGSAGPEDRPPLATPAPRWRIVNLVVVVLAAFTAAVIASLPVIFGMGLGLETAQERSPLDILLLAGLSDGAMLLAIFGLGRPLLGLSARDLGLAPGPSAGALLTAARVAGLLWLVSIGVNAVQTRLAGPNPQSLVVSLGAHNGPAAFLIDLVTSAAIAPFAEEVLFRGLIFGGLAQRMPVAIAAAISALLFALAHGLTVVAPIFVLGLGLAWVYHRTRSLWAAMLTHSLVNAISLTLLFALPKELLAS